MQVDSRAESRPANKFNRFPIDLLLVLCALSAFFYKSVFLGKPITKMGLLPTLDAMFNPDLKKAILRFQDPSGYLIYFPNGFFEEQCWQHFLPPLWNPLVACGYPLFGDPQSLMHSFAHLFALFSGPQAYNTGLLLEIGIGGVGMVLLGRICGLSQMASVLAALAYVLSPRVLVQVDIGGNECFFPWVFLAFAWLALSPSLLRACLVGVFCSVVAFACHPETVFFAVAFAALLCFFYILLDGLKYGRRQERLRRLTLNFVKASALLLVTASVSLAVAAPLVFPFFEFMSNAHIYKAEQEGVVQASSWRDFFGGLYANQGYEPYFIGAVAILLAPLGLLLKKRLSRAFALTLACILPLCMPSGFLLDIMSKRPFSYVATYYGIAEVLMILALAAGLGLDRIRSRPGSFSIIVLCLSFLVAFLYPFWQVHTELLSTNLTLIWQSGHKLLQLTSIIVLAGFLACFLFFVRSKFVRVVAVVALLALNFASLALAGRNVLPVNPAFQMQAPEPVAFLRDTKARCLATGYHFFLPNTNIDFGVRDFRCFSPLLPVRYQGFLKSCGAESYNLYFYALPDICSPLLDLASVKYVVTRAAIRGANDDLECGEPLPSPGYCRILPGLRISSARLYFDASNSQIDARLVWKVHDPCRLRYSLQYFVVDATGKEVWSGRESVLAPAPAKKHEWLEELSIPVPPDAEFPVKCAVRVVDTWTGAELQAPSIAASPIGGFVISSVSNHRTNKVPLPRHFKLVKTFEKESCRIYENCRALPEAYLVENAVFFRPNQKQLLLTKLHSSDFDPQNSVLLESDQADAVLGKSPLRKGGLKALEINRVDCNRIELSCRADRESFLVLTDSYYPGWKCFVDDKESPIYPANYLFRAVKIGAGDHKVRFVFVPWSYYNSLTLSLSVLAGTILLAIRRRKEIFSTIGRL